MRQWEPWARQGGAGGSKIWRSPVVLLLLVQMFAPSVLSSHWDLTHVSDYQAYHANPTHLLLCPRYIRQGQPYRFLVSLFQLSRPVLVTATIHRDSVELSKLERELSSEGVPELLTLQLPAGLSSGQYRLSVEGSINDYNGGTAFKNETRLILLQRSFTAIVQTDRPLYRQGQTVRFRIIPVTTDFEGYQEALDVVMLNPRDIEMKRWLSRRTIGGWLALEYPLAEITQYGRWTIRVKANGYSHEEHFYVKEYPEAPAFEVRVHSPSFIVSSDQCLRGTVYATYSSGALVTGNISVVAVVEAIDDEDSRESRGYEMSLDCFHGIWDFEFPIGDLLQSTSNVPSYKLVVKAKVLDARTSLVRKGYSESLIFKKSYTLRFEGPSKQVFKPGLPFRAYIELRYQDGTPVEQEWFRGRPVSHYLRASLFVPGLTAQPKLQYPRIFALGNTRWEVQIDATPNWSNSSRYILLEAHLFDEFFGVERSKLVLVPKFSENSHHLSISTSTRNAKVDEYIIFHVRANYYVESFQYLIMAKGVIIKSSVESMTSSIRTFAVTLTKQMAPKALIIVYDLTADDKLLADSLEFSVDAIAATKMTLRTEVKDRSGSTMELTIGGDVGSLVGLSSQPLDVLASYIHHPISNKKIETALEFADSNVPHTSQIDTYSTFQASGVTLFSDAYVGRRPHVCNASPGYASCFDGSCYRASKTCNGVVDCADGADEFLCHHRHAVDWERFRRTRRNLVSSDFEATWLWKDLTISTTGRSVSIPTPTSRMLWALSAIGISPFRGVYTLPNPEMVTSSRFFFMSVDSPEVAHLGEQFSVRVALFNFGQTKLEVLVTLANSLDYKFVYVNALDRDNNDKLLQPITMFGEHQHLVFLWPQRPVVLLFPIVGIRPGNTNLTVAAKTQTSKTSTSKTIWLQPEGFKWSSWTSMLVDIPRGAYVMKQLDTGVPNPQEPPLALAASQSARDYNTAVITVTGSAFGPPFPVSPLTVETVFGLPGGTAEANVFSFAANLLSLQLIQSNKNLVRKHRQVFNYLFVCYQKQLSFQRENGGFAMFTHAEVPVSVWLTAFTARYFHKANRLFPEWKNFVHIDHKVLERSLAFLLAAQAKSGAFQDHDGYFTYDRKMAPKGADDSHKVANVSLTAFVVIALHELQNLDGPLTVKILQAIHLAQNYLESSIRYIDKDDDPYQLAITAYALRLIGSSEAEYAFTQLDRKYIQDGDLRFWSKRRFSSELGGLPLFSPHPSHTPQVGPLVRSDSHALDVETTSYALLAYLHGKAISVKPIVDWINHQRINEGGWASTQDTVVAMEALLEHEKRTFGSDAEERELSITLTFEAPCLPGMSKQFHVSFANRYLVQRFRIPNAWGSIMVKARGVGVALLQMQLQSQHRLPAPPVSSSLSLNVKVFSSGNNHSRLHFRSCQSWIAERESLMSGLVVLEAQLPTGYQVDQDTLLHYVHTATSRNLRHAHADQSKATFYFDYLDLSPICINFTALRLLPTALIKRDALVKVYEYHEPERYNQTLVDLSFLHGLQVCDVCGSYQCLDCPSYNGGTSPSTGFVVALMLLSSVIICLCRVNCT